MAKTSKLATVEPQTLATQLYTIQDDIRILREREEFVKNALLKDLKKQHVKSVKLEDGTHFIISLRQTLKIKDEDKARVWAEKNYCVKIDNQKALRILRRSLKRLPGFFSLKTTEYLTVRRSNENEEETEGE